jgi:hypothetical protein
MGRNSGRGAKAKTLGLSSSGSGSVDVGLKPTIIKSRGRGQKRKMSTDKRQVAALLTIGAIAASILASRGRGGATITRSALGADKASLKAAIAVVRRANPKKLRIRLSKRNIVDIDLMRSRRGVRAGARRLGRAFRFRKPKSLKKVFTPTTKASRAAKGKQRIQNYAKSRIRISNAQEVRKAVNAPGATSGNLTTRSTLKGKKLKLTSFQAPESPIIRDSGKFGRRPRKYARRKGKKYRYKSRQGIIRFFRPK